MDQWMDMGLRLRRLLLRAQGQKNRQMFYAIVVQRGLADEIFSKETTYI